jgi:hypothetical protein
MPKYAILWTTDGGYLPGTNGALNAFEYYGFPKEIDRHVMVWNSNGFTHQDPYWKSWPDVRTTNLDTSFWPTPQNAYWYMVFADINYAIQLLDEYDVVLLWGADVCPLDNFSDYFDVCHKLDRMILGHNEQGAQSYNAMSKAEPYGHTWDVPYADIPFFIPKSCKPILQNMLRMQATPGNLTDRMDGLNYALRDAGHIPLVVPGTLWVFNATGWGNIWDGGNGALYFCNQRMQSFHRKHWIAAYARNYMQNAGPVAKHNQTIFNRTWRFFNSQCRVKWTEGIDVYDGT